jgi:large subunit ribosomal protein L32e
MKELLLIKNEMKKKKPDFVRTDSNKKRFKNKWRKPRGLHNKRRLKKKGHQKNPSIGYKSPTLVRGLHKSGLELIQVSNIQDLSKIKGENQAALLSSTLGNRKRLQILEICKKENIQVFNIKNIDSYISEIKDELEARKQDRKKKLEKKKKKEQKKEEKPETKKQEEKQEKIKEKVLEAKPEVKSPEMKEVKEKDSTKAKMGHLARSVPGSKQ